MAAVRESSGLPAADHCKRSGGDGGLEGREGIGPLKAAECLQRGGAGAIGIVLFCDGIELRRNGRVVLEIAKGTDDALGQMGGASDSSAARCSLDAEAPPIWPRASAAVARTPQVLSLRSVSPRAPMTSSSFFILPSATTASARSARSPAFFN